MRRRALRTLIMWITQHLAARTLVWLAAVAIPMQGVASARCGCSSVKACSNKAVQSTGCCCASGQPGRNRCPCTGAKVCRCGETSSCHKQAHACSSGQCAKASCCSGCCCSPTRDGTCPCGANCHCGKNNAPTAPATPPVERNSPERIVASSVAVTSLAMVSISDSSRQYLDFCSEGSALAASERCVLLCRFTL